MENKKCIYKNISINDKRKIFYVSDSDGRLISDKVRTLSEAISEARKINYEFGIYDSTLKIVMKGEDGALEGSFFADIHSLREIKKRGYAIVWMWNCNVMEEGAELILSDVK